MLWQLPLEDENVDGKAEVFNNKFFCTIGFKHFYRYPLDKNKNELRTKGHIHRHCEDKSKEIPIYWICQDSEFLTR